MCVMNNCINHLRTVNRLVNEQVWSSCILDTDELSTFVRKHSQDKETKQQCGVSVFWGSLSSDLRCLFSKYK